MAAEIEKWIHKTLTSDAALMGIVTGVWRQRAAQNARFPFVVIRLMSSVDTNTLGLLRVINNAVYQVVVEGEFENDYDEDGAVRRVDALLQSAERMDASPSFVCQRVQEISSDAFESPLSTRMAGGLYQFIILGES